MAVVGPEAAVEASAAAAAALPDDIATKVSQCKILVVGAGGIGCELLKNLVLTGFTNLEVHGNRTLASVAFSFIRS